MLPDELLLEIFDSRLRTLENWEKPEYWEKLVHVCQRWRSIVFSAPLRLCLRLVCTSRTPVRERLYIWPKLPIILHVIGGLYEIADNIIAALEHHDRIYEIDVDNVLNDELEPLVEAMEASFPALTRLSLDSNSGWNDNTAPFLTESFLGGPAPNLQSLCLGSIEFPALPNLLLSAKHLVYLCLVDITSSAYESMVDCMSSLTWLETLIVQLRSSQLHPYRASQRPPPTTRTVLPVLTSLNFQGLKEHLDHLFTHIDAPLLEVFDISFFNPVGFDHLQLFPFIGRTKTFEGFNHAYMEFGDDLLDVTLSPRKLTTGGMSLSLSTAWTGLDWDLWSLTQDCRLSPPSWITIVFEDRPSPPWTKDMGTTPWLDFLRVFTAVENLYLSTGLVLCIAPALGELAGGGVTEVLPALQNIFIERPQPSEAGIIQEVVGRFVAARELSGRPVGVNIG